MAPGGDIKGGGVRFARRKAWLFDVPKLGNRTRMNNFKLWCDITCGSCSARKPKIEFNVIRSDVVALSMPHGKRECSVLFFGIKFRIKKNAPGRHQGGGY